MHMGIDDTERVVMFVTTMRPNEIVRIISYRRASSEERETFFQHIRVIVKNKANNFIKSSFGLGRSVSLRAPYEKRYALLGLQ